MTEDEALALYASGWWEHKTVDEIVRVQLYEDVLCMPFPIYRAAISEVLNREVWTHEFADPVALQEEYEGVRPMQTVDEVLERFVEMMNGRPVIVVEDDHD